MLESSTLGNDRLIVVQSSDAEHLVYTERVGYGSQLVLDKQYNWRAGFEVEVILGDLDDERFIEDAMFEPMDVASDRYCQAVAKELTALTGRSWSAPRTSPRRPGFYVLSEYDLDPLNWPDGRYGGVELLTPPLPLDEAENVRRAIVAAIVEIDGRYNCRPSEPMERCAWHINIDAVDERLTPANYLLACNELPMLANNGRLFSQYATPQRHRYGLALLRHLKADPEAKLIQLSSLGNFLFGLEGRGKRFACNFNKLEFGYVELRHFSTLTFFNGPDLRTLIQPITRGFEMWAVEETPLEEAMTRRFQVVAEWLQSFRGRLSWELGSGFSTAEGPMRLDRQTVADLFWNGDIKLSVRGTRKYQYAATMYDVQISDLPEALALLAMDLVELDAFGYKGPGVGSSAFKTLLNELSDRLSQPQVQIPKPDAGLRKTIFAPTESSELDLAGR